MNNHVVNYLRDTLNNLLNDIKKMFNTFGEFDEDTLIKIHHVLSLFDEVLDNYVVCFEDNIDDLKSAFFKPVVDCVGFVPRDDLVNLAESLININSLRRKFDFNLDTVGGDIDVAILASGEAFYWKNK